MIAKAFQINNSIRVPVTRKNKNFMNLLFYSYVSKVGIQTSGNSSGNTVQSNHYKWLKENVENEPIHNTGLEICAKHSHHQLT